jgi:3-oxoacyl-[acyl-carrier-protein] synthase-3
MKGLPVQISAVGGFTPDRRLTNADLEKRVDTTDEWIRTRTGIRERRIVEKGVGVSDLAAGAARKALAARGVPPEEIDLIVLATITPDSPVPAAACLVQRKIGARNAWAFDLSGACSGFVYALAVGAQFVATGAHRRVLVIGADIMSAIVDFTDRATCVLFGDGAGAVLLEPAPPGRPGLLDFILKADGSGADLLCLPGGGSLHPSTHESVDRKMHFLKQEGQRVFKHAVEGMSGVTREIIERNGLKADDIALLIPHQANLRIIEFCAKSAGFPLEKVLINIDRYGNTTAATIPLGLAEAVETGRIKAGDRVVLASFGAGYTWGSALLQWAY